MIPTLFTGDTVLPSLSCPPRPPATRRGVFQARMSNKNPVRKRQRGAILLRVISSLWLSYGDSSRIAFQSWGCAILGQLFPFPSQHQEEELQVALLFLLLVVAREKHPCCGRVLHSTPVCFSGPFGRGYLGCKENFLGKPT